MVRRERESENLAKSLEEARRDIKLHLKQNSDKLDPVNPKTVEGYVLPRPIEKGRRGDSYKHRTERSSALRSR